MLGNLRCTAQSQKCLIRNHLKTCQCNCACNCSGQEVFRPETASLETWIENLIHSTLGLHAWDAKHRRGAMSEARSDPTGRATHLLLHQDILGCTPPEQERSAASRLWLLLHPSLPAPQIELLQLSQFSLARRAWCLLAHRLDPTCVQHTSWLFGIWIFGCFERKAAAKMATASDRSNVCCFSLPFFVCNCVNNQSCISVTLSWNSASKDIKSVQSTGQGKSSLCFVSFSLAFMVFDLLSFAVFCLHDPLFPFAQSITNVQSHCRTGTQGSSTNMSGAVRRLERVAGQNKANNQKQQQTAWTGGWMMTLCESPCKSFWQKRQSNAIASFSFHGSSSTDSVGWTHSQNNSSNDMLMLLLLFRKIDQMLVASGLVKKWAGVPSSTNESICFLLVHGRFFATASSTHNRQTTHMQVVDLDLSVVRQNKRQNHQNVKISFGPIQTLFGPVGTVSGPFSRSCLRSQGLFLRSCLRSHALETNIWKHHMTTWIGFGPSDPLRLIQTFFYWVLRPIGSNWIFICAFGPCILNGCLLTKMWVWKGLNPQLADSICGGSAQVDCCPASVRFSNDLMMGFPKGLACQFFGRPLLLCRKQHMLGNLWSSAQSHLCLI